MRMFALVLVLSLGCVKREAGSSEPASATAGDEPQTGSDVVCERERVPGSHTKRKVCRTTAERDASRAAAERMLRSGAPSAPVTEGGLR